MSSSIPTQTQEQKKKCNCDCDLLLWKNPIETGKIFFGSLIALLILKKVNLITFFLRVGYTILLTTGTIEFVSKAFLGQGLVTKYGIKECPNTVGMIKPHIDEFLKQLPVKQAKVRMLVFASVPKNTFKAAVTLYLLHKLFSIFSLWTLLVLVDLAVFTLPIVYKTYQKEIDAAVQQGCKLTKQKTTEYSNLVCQKIKPHLEKVGPLKSLVEKCQQRSSAAPTSSTAKLASQVPLESTAKTSSAQVLPNVPATEPLSNATKEFDVDQLTSEIKQSKEQLKDELNQF